MPQAEAEQDPHVPETQSSAEPISEQPVESDAVYSVFTVPQKKAIVLAAAFGAVFSPISTTIYLPGLDQIASDLHVSNSQINLTVTTFLVRIEALKMCVTAAKGARVTGSSRSGSNDGRWFFRRRR